MSRAIGLVALAACAKVPEPPPELGDDLITVSYENGGVQVRGPLEENGEHLYEMTFPDTDDQIGMPDSFKVGGRETLRLLPDDCNRERRIGVALFPAGVVTSGEIADFGGDSNVETIVEAPGLAKIRVTYDIEYLCPAPESFRGESVFTFFPSGRIVREDIDLHPSDGGIDPLPGASDQCGCSDTAQDFFFTSFWAFNDNGMDEQVDANNTMPRDGITSAACTMYPSHGVGVAWPDASTRFHPSVASTHVYDFVANQNTLPEQSRSVTSAVQVHNGLRVPGTCAKILEQLVDPGLLVGSERLDSTDHDGIYRPKLEHAETTVLTSEEGIPGSWAISMNLGGADHGRIKRQPDIEDFVRFHSDPETPGNTVFVFKQGLAPGESITIEPI
jgi:hypothetical protein